VQFSPEFHLALDCCRAHFAPGAPIAATSVEDVDWNAFLHLARFHRIQGLVWNRLSQHPHLASGVAENLRAEAAEIAGTNLVAAVECAALLRAFSAAGLPILFLKGLALGQLAYGNPALKAAIDIDVLIDPNRLAESARVLEQLGYDPAEPPSAARLARWHRWKKDSLWVKTGSGTKLDLHTRVTDNPRLLRGLGVHSPQRQVEVASGISLPTFAPEELFAHLAVHGASSAWFRLKWISDFAAIASVLGPRGIQVAYDTSLKLGAGRAGAQALLLAHRLFGTLSEVPELYIKLRSDHRNRLLANAALKQVSAPWPKEPTQRLGGTLRIHWTQLLLLPGARFGLGELGRQARAALIARP